MVEGKVVSGVVSVIVVAGVTAMTVRMGLGMRSEGLVLCDG